MIPAMHQHESAIASIESACIQETQEMWVQSLGQEDSLEKRMAIHTGILA